MSTAQVVALAVPTKDKQIDLIEYLERRWFAHRVMMDGNT
jgi:hypothetical protein